MSLFLQNAEILMDDKTTAKFLVLVPIVITNRKGNKLKLFLFKHKSLIIIILLFLSSINLSFSQNYFFMQGVGNLQTGTAAGDLWSANNNQAGLAFYKADIGAGFHYKNQFLLKELGMSAGAFSFKAKGGSLGLSYSSYGSSLFNTKKITLGFGKMFGKRLAAGVGLDYINIYQSGNYGSANIFTFDFGMLAKPSDKVAIGAHVFNPIRAELGDYLGEKIPVFYNMGLVWIIDENFKIMADAMNDEVNQIKFSGAAEYKIMDLLYVRIGIMTNNRMVFNFGFGLHLGDIHVDFSSSMHQVLGYSPGVSLSYDFIK